MASPTTHTFPPRHAPTPSYSSAHSHSASFSSAYSTIPPVPSGSHHSHSNSMTSSHAHTPSIGHAHTPSLGHPPLTPIKELASARSSPARPATVAAQREAEESGAPTSGIYARNGLWDDDSDENNDNDKGGLSWRQRLSGSTSSNTGDRRSVKSTKSTKTSGSGGSRSRSNTLNGIAGPSPTVESGPWPWVRKSSGPTPPAPAMSATPTLPNHGRVPSMADNTVSRPPSAQRPPSAAQVFPGAWPSPAMTLASPAVDSPAAPSPANFSSPVLPSHPSLPEVPQLKQRKSRLRLRSKTARQNEAMETQEAKTPAASRPPLAPQPSNVTNIQVTAYPDAKAKSPTPVDPKAVDGRSKSAWKRGMERLWRSKSAGALREQYRQSDQENLPPVPSLPRELAHENVRARLVSQTSVAPNTATSRPMSPTVTSPAVQSPAITSPALSPPMILSPDLSSTSPHLQSLDLPGNGASIRGPQRNDIGDSIRAQLDQKYPSYRARSPRTPLDSDGMDDDPFASTVDYSQPTSHRRPSHSPLPDFAVLPPPPPIPGSESERPSSPRNSPSLTNLKQSLVPRLRKSKSMGLARRPSSILSAFRGNDGGSSGRRSRAASPAPSPAVRPSTPERNPGLDELVHMAMGQSPLAPPRPLFYDSFDLADDGDKDEDKEEPPSELQPEFESDAVPTEPLERVETIDVRPSTSRSASPRPRKSSTSQAPDLSIDVATAPSVSGSSIELVTPAVSAPGRFSPSQSSSEALDHGSNQYGSSPTPIEQTGTSQGGHGQIGIWPSPSEEALAHALAEKVHTRDENPARDDRSETCPSTFGSQSWEAAIAAFPTIDDNNRTSTYYDFDTDTGPGERESLASNTAVAPTDSCEHSGADETPPTTGRPSYQRTPSTGYATPSDFNSAMWSSWRDVPRRSSSRNGSRGSSRGSSRDRRARTVEGAWDGPDSDTSSDSEEEDDIALGSLHPSAAAAQQQRIADQKKRREARRAARAARAAKKEAELRRSNTAGATVRRRPREWNGEGVHPDALAGQLERVAVSSTAPPIPSRALRPPPPDRSPLESGNLSRSTTLGRSSTSGHSARSGASASGHRIASDGDAHAHSTRMREQQQRVVSEGDSRSAALSRAPSAASSMRRPRAHSNASRQVPSMPAEPTPVRRSVPVRCKIAQGSDVRSCALDAFPETTARDVIIAARQRGDIGEGNWVVFESFAELGLERQVREHEVILSGVTKGWDSSQSQNAMVLREVPPHNIWTRSIPENPPMVSAWVQLETKPGKWTKKWLDVRGGQVFLSKNEKGKDEVHVSTLFSDIYTLRKPHNAPQPYTFALKRLDAAASFQNPSEYISYIATDESAGWKLHGAIFASRSFAMAQADPTVRTRLHPPSASLASSTSSAVHTKHSNHSHSSLHRAPTSASNAGPAPPSPLIAQIGRAPPHPHHALPSHQQPNQHHASSQMAPPHRRPTTSTKVPRPLVDLNADQTGFTGQGLLRRNHHTQL